MDRIALKEIRKEYSAFTLNGVSFPVKEGFITGFIGPNGSGKTTTIRAILNLNHLNGGEVHYRGVRQEDNDYLQDVGIVLDESYFPKDWSVEDVNNVLSVGYKNWKGAEFLKRVAAYGIDKKLNVKSLSRGMTTKLMLAAALSHGAKTLILDEPTSGLDPRSRDEFRDTIQRYMAEDEENTVLFSTHITEDLEAIADYIAFIMDGEMIFYGTKDDFLETYRIVKCSEANLSGMDPKKILGKKKTSTHVEVLVTAEVAKAFGENTVVEKPSIDRIMTFYHRGDEDA
ncbi:ABC transporter ATP-binding protein [Peptoniphilus sp. EMRHCC_23]|uniref:ABC transporter ATP-binding protein n=1 Tax=Peptoniphilus rachelemmaiella TaxID=2811779 RepID=UPI001C000D34|nr:ABC transporter ATP-binding protein [Peptoniphilus rachelemmaiella]